MSLEILMGQIVVGLINGSFYALLSLGFAVIFGLLGIINVAQGTFYMLGAFGSWMLLNYAGIGYWPALILSPVIAGAVGMALEKTLIARVYKLDHIYGLLLTYGVMMFIQGMFVYWFATAGRPYPVPFDLRGGFDLGFLFLPKYRAWVVLASLIFCFGTWFAIEKTSLGRTLRAATENPQLTRAFGITVFAVVVVGGMGSILGAIVTGLGLGVVEGLTKVFYPPGANMVIFVIMFIVLLIKPAGLFG